MLARQIVIGFGVAVIFPLLVYYGVATFDSPPHMRSVPMPTQPFNATAQERDAYWQARKVYDEELKRALAEYTVAAQAFARTLILVTAPVGVAAILIGAFMQLQSIGTGLIFGGITTVGFGYWSYWQFLENWMRFVSLLAGFAILVFVAYRQFAVTRSSHASPA